MTTGANAVSNMAQQALKEAIGNFNTAEKAVKEMRRSCHTLIKILEDSDSLEDHDIKKLREEVTEGSHNAHDALKNASRTAVTVARIILYWGEAQESLNRLNSLLEILQHSTTSDEIHETMLNTDISAITTSLTSLLKATMEVTERTAETRRIEPSRP